MLVRLVLHPLPIVDRRQTEWVYLIRDEDRRNGDIHGCIVDPNHNRQRIPWRRILAIDGERAFLVAACDNQCDQGDQRNMSKAGGGFQHERSMSLQD
ncbi:hypothetical protein C405_07685 [Stenotrophomonas maltophilia AU12-09]|nr:hypothetical protein C405_07685 [Stenotrophomonas maltophilia AU12-09]